MANDMRPTGITERDLWNPTSITYHGQKAEIFNSRERQSDGFMAVKIVIEQYIHVHLAGYIDEKGELIAREVKREAFRP
jgi:hypothetical protein